MEIKSTKNVLSNGVKMLIYGESGAGKTTLIKTLPRPFVISAEKGLLSLQDCDIPYVEVHNLQELGETYDYVKDNPDFDTVCIDSISEIAEIVLANEKASVKDGRMAYGNLRDEIRGLIRDFKDINKNIYMIAKMEKCQDDTGKIFYTAGCPGNKLSQDIPYGFDEVFCLMVGKTEDGNLERMLLTSPDGAYNAKDRSGKLNIWENPDLTQIIKKIGGNNGN